MEKSNMLKFNCNKLFNNERLHEYDEDGQKGFLGYLLRHNEWKIILNEIVFPNVDTMEKVENLIEEYNNEVRRENIQAKQQVLLDVSVWGVEEIRKRLDDQLKETEKKAKDKNMMR